MEWYSRVSGVSGMIDIRIELWTDIKDSAPYLTIGYANNQNFIKLLYSNWCHYSPLILSNNNLISRKNKLIKGKKNIEVTRDYT